MRRVYCTLCISRAFLTEGGPLEEYYAAWAITKRRHWRWADRTGPYRDVRVIGDE